MVIEGKEPCPHVELDFAANTFVFSGTCYPENTAEFFDPIFAKLAGHLNDLTDAAVLFELKLSYFNSGASRAFSQFFEILEGCASKGNAVTVNWYCEEGDDNMIELATDFEEDFQAATYAVVVVDAF